MLTPLVPQLTRRRLIMCATVAAVVAAVVAGLALWRSAGRPAPVSEPPRSPSAIAATPVTHRPSPTSTRHAIVALPPLPRTEDPVTYAREVADALFGVSPVSVSRGEFLQFWTGELPTVVYTDAASKGLTLAAQNADAIDTLTRWWIPPAAGWASEAAEHTTNRFAATSVTVPDYWVNAVAGGTFRDPGLHMERVMGVLTMSYGPDPLHRETAARSVVIDLGLLCGPTQVGGCRLVAPQPPPDLGGD
jgi:hypothetical protein